MMQKYDLIDRSTRYAMNVRALLRLIPKTPETIDDIRQLMRSSGSIGANYIEANESLGKNDFLMHLKISRKETKESMFWIDLLSASSNKAAEFATLKQEAKEFVLIFNSMISKIPKS